MRKKTGCDLSFSGLKTALVKAWEDAGKDAAIAPHLAAALQEAIKDCLVDRCFNAMARFRDEVADKADFVVAGGVAANALIRAQLKDLADGEILTFTPHP